MNRPESILRALDQHLVEPTSLILYGRAALALAFPAPPTGFLATMDVDVILPEIEMETIEANDAFWSAIEQTNEQLDGSGLYITHLFSDSQVILRPDWLQHLVPLFLEGLRFLKLYRPAIEDLILTKMMRVDPQDRSDIEFLLSQKSLDSAQLKVLVANARIPDIPEIRQAFDLNCSWLGNLVQGH